MVTAGNAPSCRRVVPVNVLVTFSWLNTAVQ